MKRIVAALLCACIALGLSACGGGGTSPAGSGGGASQASGGTDGAAVKTLSSAEYPEIAPYPDEESFYGKGGKWDDEGYQKASTAWRESLDAVRVKNIGYSAYPDDFIKSIAPRLLSGAGEENRVCSPANVYMALAMLAEITDGNTRSQILDLMGAPDIETARLTANVIWRNHYNDDGQVTCLLGSSMWMRDHDVNFNTDTLDTLAREYYADAYMGDTASPEMTEAMRDWINEHTGGLLKEQASQEALDADTVIALISTIYYKAGWEDEFYEQFNTTETFHSPKGDEECTFMHGGEDAYYYGERFGAVSRNLAEGGRMLFILPDEGVTVDELLSDTEAVDFMVRSRDWENIRYLKVNLSLPKFDVTSRTDLIPELKALGVTDVMDSNISDFSPLTTDEHDMALSEANHAARVKIDEKGVEAAAYTIMITKDSAAIEDRDEIDFILDRPFIFVITGQDGLPLFTGVVNDPIA